jgi:WS/DGAT/MGAT family acyltransferase
MQQITPQDALFYYAEGDKTYAHGTFAWFYDGSSPGGKKFTYEELLQHVGSRLNVASIFTQKVVPVPLHLDYPYWVTDDDFEIENHVHHEELAKPGSWQQFAALLCEIHSEPLAMDRPLWDLTLVTGLDDIDWLPKGAFALIGKFHHVAIDGATGMNILSGLHDTTADRPAPRRKASAAVPRSEAPGLASMLNRAVVNNIRRPFGLLRSAGGILRDLPKVLPFVRLSDMADAGKAPKTLFNAEVHAARVFENRVFPVDDIKKMRRAAKNATFNDVVLTLCAGGLRHYMESQDDLPSESMVAGCPINIRSEDEADSGGNMISAMTTRIHTNIADPIERLKAVTRSTRKAKATVSALGARRMVEINDAIPAPSLVAMKKLAEFAPSGSGDRRIFNCPISNLPGPQTSLYLNGAKLLYLTCAMPVMDGYGLFIGALTYDGSLCIAMTSSENILPEPEKLGDCMERSFNEFKAATEKLA